MSENLGGKATTTYRGAMRTADKYYFQPLHHLAHMSKMMAAGALFASLSFIGPSAYAANQSSVNSQSAPTAQGGATPAQATKALDAHGWLQKLADMVATQNFHVAFVQARAGLETIPWLWRHGVMNDGTVMEQLNLQNGPGQEQIRVGQVVSVFEPDVPPYSVRSGAIHGPIPAMLLNQPARLEQAYKFVTVGRARISGRTAQQLRIISRDNTRFSYQLWLDESTGMLLKLDTVDLQGNVLEQIQVTSFEVTDEPHDYFSKVNQSSLPQPMAGGRGQVQPHHWQVGFLPKGMVEVSQNVRRLALTGQAVEHKLFSDGLVDVSVYVQSAKQAIGSDLALRHDLNTFLTFTSGAAQVTIVGQIPLKTANAMAQSLTLSKENQ